MAIHLIVVEIFQSGPDIHGPQRMNHTGFGGPLIFLLAPPASKSFHLTHELPQHLLRYHGSQRMYLKVTEPLICYLPPP